MSTSRAVHSAILVLGVVLALAGCGSRGFGPRSVASFEHWLQASAPPGQAPLWVILADEKGATVVGSPSVGNEGTSGVFPVGSITKVLTAILVLQAAQEGALALDDPAPGVFHPSGDVVTWRHLLEHRAGFLDKRLDPSRPEASVPVVPPGLLYVYSNEGYAALARGLETVLGGDFESLARDRVFAPLGLEGLHLRGELPTGSWSPPLGASGLEGEPQALARFAAAVASRDPRILTREGWSRLFELDLWDRHTARRFDDPPRFAFVQEGRVTGARSTLAIFPGARAAMLLMFAEVDVFRDQAGERRLYEILNQGTLRWGDRKARINLGWLNPRTWFSPPPCDACDWSDRIGVYLDPRSGSQVVISDVGGAPLFMADDGEPLHIGPRITGARNRLHDLYRPIVTTEDTLEAPWANGASPATIEFAERDGLVVGLLWGANWYERPTPP